MSRLWLNDGGIVLESGALTLCDTCPCYTGTGTIYDCNACLNGWAAADIEVVMAGFTVGLCGACANYNATFALPTIAPYGTYTCSWKETWNNLLPGGHCGGTDITFTITYTPAPTNNTVLQVYPQINNNPMGYFKTISGQLNCLSFDETLTRGAGSATACGWPATIRVKSR